MKTLLAVLLMGVLCFAGSVPTLDCSGSQDELIELIKQDGREIPEIGMYLEYKEGELHQYATIVPSDHDPKRPDLSLIEETWTRQGDKDVIEQWIITDEGPTHRLMVEEDGAVISIEPLDTDQAEDVRCRVIERFLSKPTKPWA